MHNPHLLVVVSSLYDLQKLRYDISQAPKKGVVKMGMVINLKKWWQGQQIFLGPKVTSPSEKPVLTANFNGMTIRPGLIALFCHLRNHKIKNA